MKLNKKQKKHHPQANLIPDPIWNNSNLFSETLPSYLLPLMQVAEVNLFSELDAIISHVNSKQSKQCVWLAIVYSHPQLSSENFLNIANRLGMSDSLLFHTAALSGNLAVLKELERKHAGTNWLKSIILFNNYATYKGAAEHNQPEVLEYLVSKVPQQRQKIISSRINVNKNISTPKKIWVNTLQDMIASEQYYAYKWAVYRGSFSTIKYLENAVKDDPNTLQKMLASEEYEVLRLACENGNLEIFKHLEKQIPPQILQKKIKADNYALPRKTLLYSHTEMFHYLESKLSTTELRAMIKASQYEAFIIAFLTDNLNLFKHFESLVPNDFKKMIALGSYKVILSSGDERKDIIKYFESKFSSKELEEMEKINNFHSFKWAALHGQLQVFEKFENKVGSTSKIFQDMIASNNYEIFSLACFYGDIKLVKYLGSKVSPVVFREMVRAQGYKCYIDAAGKSLEVIKYLEDMMEPAEEVEKMNAASNFLAFRTAAQHNRLDIIQHFEKKWPKLLKKMIKAENYDAFDSRIYNTWVEDTLYSKLELIGYLAKKVPSKLTKIIELHGPSLLEDAIIEEDMEMLNFLRDNAKPEQMQEMLQYRIPMFRDTDSFEILKYIDELLSSKSPSPSIRHPYNKLMHYFEKKIKKSEDPHNINHSLRYLQDALKYEQFETVNYFLSNPKLFNRIYNATGNIYDEYLKFFVEDQLAAFRELVIKAQQSSHVFDLKIPNEIELCFSMLKYLLAKSDASLSKDIEFLLGIPALRTYIKASSQETKDLLWILTIQENNQEIFNSLAIILEKNFVSRALQGLMPPKLTETSFLEMNQAPLDEIIGFESNSKDNSQQVLNSADKVKTKKRDISIQTMNEGFFERPRHAPEESQRAVDQVSNFGFSGTIN